MPVDLGRPPLAIADDLRQHALRKIAEAVRKLGIGTIDDRFRTVASVLAEGDLAQKEISERVDAEALGEHHRVDDIADALRHFLAAAEEKSMAVDLLWARQSRRHQERRPINCVEPHHILADQMDIRRPVTSHSSVSSG